MKIKYFDKAADDPPEGDGWRPIAPGFPKAEPNAHVAEPFRSILNSFAASAKGQS